MITMNKRSVSEIFPSVTKFLNEWLLRLLVLSSLCLQIILALLGNRRKYIPDNWLRFTLWLAFSGADQIAVTYIGILFNRQGDGEDNPSQQIRAFWAPFLLLHLGGQDTITAYSLEDIALSRRHFLGLLAHFVGAVYIILGSWAGTPLNILAILMFFAGLIKYGERCWYLMSISNKEFRQSIIASMVQQLMIPLLVKAPGYEERKKGDGVKLMAEYDFIPEAALLEHADKFFPIFKPLFLGLVIDSTVLETSKSKSTFEKMSWRDALGVIEIELGFGYDMFYTMFYTKAIAANNKWGFILRIFCLCLIISTFIGFFIIDKHEYSAIDVSITLLLLVVEILLETYSIILLCSSDRTMSWLSKQENPRWNLICETISSCRVPLLFPAKKRWSDSMAQRSLMSESLKSLPIKFSEVWKFFCCCPKLEERYCKNPIVVPKYLKTLIFEQLREKSRPASHIKAKQFCAHRGEWTLKKMNCFCRLGWSIGEEFDENILLWHVATEVCYYTDLNKSSIPLENSNCEASKLLSEYMLHLLVKRPHMLPDGIGEIRFQHTRRDATEFFRSGKPIKNRIQACEKLLQVHTKNPKYTENEDKIKSVLFNACKLAKHLQCLETEDKWNCEKKWEMMSHVWTEMLCYAACQCQWNGHAKELSRGGELLTHVWLLMAHFGMTEHSYDQDRKRYTEVSLFESPEY